MPSPASPQPSNGTGTGRDPFERVHTRTLGMWVFLVSLAALFSASMIGYLIMIWFMRNRREWVDDAGQVVEIPPMPDLPHLPAVLWASTIIILASSATIQWALTSIRRNNQRSAQRGMAITFILGLIFLALQAGAWLDWIDRAVNVVETHDAYRFSVMAFLVLSMLHAAHVIGGLIPMATVTIKSFRGRYSAEHHEGIHFTALYWHFLDVVWLILFAGLLVFT